MMNQPVDLSLIPSFSQSSYEYDTQHIVHGMQKGLPNIQQCFDNPISLSAAKLHSSAGSTTGGGGAYLSSSSKERQQLFVLSSICLCSPGCHLLVLSDTLKSEQNTVTSALLRMLPDFLYWVDLRVTDETVPGDLASLLYKAETVVQQTTIQEMQQKAAISASSKKYTGGPPPKITSPVAPAATTDGVNKMLVVPPGHSRGHSRTISTASSEGGGNPSEGTSNQSDNEDQYGKTTTSRMANYETGMGAPQLSSTSGDLNTASSGPHCSNSSARAFVILHDLHHGSPTFFASLVDMLHHGQTLTTTGGTPKRINSVRIIALCDSAMFACVLPPSVRSGFLLSINVPISLLSGQIGASSGGGRGGRGENNTSSFGTATSSGGSNMPVSMNPPIKMDLLSAMMRESHEVIAEDNLVRCHAAVERYLRSLIATVRAAAVSMQSIGELAGFRSPKYVELMKIAVLLFSGSSPSSPFSAIGNLSSPAGMGNNMNMNNNNNNSTTPTTSSSLAYHSFSRKRVVVNPADVACLLPHFLTHLIEIRRRDLFFSGCDFTCFHELEPPPQQQPGGGSLSRTSSTLGKESRRHSRTNSGTMELGATTTITTSSNIGQGGGGSSFVMPTLNASFNMGNNMMNLSPAMLLDDQLIAQADNSALTNRPQFAAALASMRGIYFHGWDSFASQHEGFFHYETASYQECVHLVRHSMVTQSMYPPA